MKMKHLQTMDHVDLNKKRVILRADLNVPMKNGQVADCSRLYAITETLKELAECHASITLISHFGRPKNAHNANYSLRPVIQRLSEIIRDKNIPLTCNFREDMFFEETINLSKNKSTEQMLCLENLRFFSGEKNNDKEFAKHLALFGDTYINDAFSCCHRAHASIEAIAHLLPSFAGRLLEKEIKMLTQIMEATQKPLVAIIGGSKVSTKLHVLSSLIKKVDVMFVGGAMANSFLKCLGYEVGKSLVEENMLCQAKKIMNDAKKESCQLVLPIDVTVADSLDVNVETNVVAVENIDKEKMCLDIGPKTVGRLSGFLDKAKLILWNGPVGAFEIKPFGKGSFALAKKIAQLTQDNKCQSIVGGGDTLSVISQCDLQKDFTYCSMAGGAFLEWLEGKELPGIKVLMTT